MKVTQEKPKMKEAENLYELGRQYYEGDGVSQHLITAFQYFLEAAERGHIGAQMQVGECYLHGYGVEPNYKSGLQWYRKAAKGGLLEAQYKLGRLLWEQSGKGGQKKEGLGWIEKAATGKHGEAQLFMGDCYRRGEVVELNRSVALNWYQQASQQGEFRAATMIAHCSDWTTYTEAETIGREHLVLADWSLDDMNSK